MRSQTQTTEETTSCNTPFLRLRGVSYAYSRVRDENPAAAGALALDRVDFELERGGGAWIYGPSGGGKTTLLRLIAGFDRPTAGEIHVNGLALHDPALDGDALARFRRETLGFIFQEDRLEERLSAAENAALPLLLDGAAPGEALARAREALEALEFGAPPEREVARLSGGQRRRVAVARALIRRPPLLLADEPVANLDAATARLVARAIFTEQEKRGATAVLVSHDLPDGLPAGWSRWRLEAGTLRREA